jgi:colicin import membrane protein
MSDGSFREKRGGLSLNGMIFLSLLLHLALLSLLFFPPSFPSPKMTFGPVYSVSLVSFTQNVLEQKRSSTAAAKELMATDRPETIVKKRLDPAPAVPIRSLEIRKKRDPDLEKAMEEIRKRAAATGVAKLAPAKAVPEKTEKTETTAGSASSPGGKEMDAQMQAYYAAIWSRIKGKWALPQGILPGEVLETVIDVTILRSGAVTGVNFEKRSGNRYFDESALKAIQKASPLPPLPAWIGDGSIGVGIRFHSSEMIR